MKVRALTAAVLTAGAAAALIASATPAQALASRLYVTAGSAPSGTTITLQGSSTAAPTIRDTRSGATITCQQATATGRVMTGANQSPQNAGQITNSTWVSCTAAGGAATVTHTSGSVWGLSPINNSTPPTAAGAPPAAGQTTNGVTSGVSLTVALATCRFAVTGGSSHDISNNSTTGLQLTAPSGGQALRVGSVALSGGATTCLGGLIQVNDPIQLNANFAVTGTVTSTGVAANPVWFNAS